jgi:hypothetical protein
MDVTALFDNVDTAQHALVNMQALGIFPSRYKIKALHIPNGYGYGYGHGSPEMWGVQSGIRYAAEPPNREVQLLLTVEESAVERAKSSLISNYGRLVRVKQ